MNFLPFSSIPDSRSSFSAPSSKQKRLFSKTPPPSLSPLTEKHVLSKTRTRGGVSLSLFTFLFLFKLIIKTFRFGSLEIKLKSLFFDFFKTPPFDNYHSY